MITPFSTARLQGPPGRPHPCYVPTLPRTAGILGHSGAQQRAPETPASLESLLSASESWGLFDRTKPDLDQDLVAKG